jgi:glyoxylase-like metal-dependent hydrolase (beta-lactamase superfamily II)
MRKGFARLAVLASVTAATYPLAAVADRQAPASAAGIRLYVLDGGTLTVKEPTGFGLTRAEVKETDMVSPAFLIVHPTGSLLWDTGLGDHLIGRPASETMVGAFGQTVSSSLKSQLAAIGYAPGRITHLALSHMHFDHVGNANDYATATWLVQRPERVAMFGDQAPSSNPAAVRYSALRDARTMILDGDHDVFGDGTVVIKSTPGHTPGHQSLFVRLTRTGAIVLSGDLYHYPEERKLNRMPAREATEGRTAASRTSLDAFIKTTSAELWIQHDLVRWRQLKKSPAYYD